VYLSGRVDTYFEKLRADQIAAKAESVKQVRNNLVVLDDRSPLLHEPYVHDFSPLAYPWYAPPPTSLRSDDEIRDEIAEELFWSPFVDVADVTVRVEAGVATLRGDVNSYSEMHSAIANAYEGGALRVNNQLQVIP
jgi:osmotically-inducible protein OsmY